MTYTIDLDDDLSALYAAMAGADKPETLMVAVLNNERANYTAILKARESQKIIDALDAKPDLKASVMAEVDKAAVADEKAVPALPDDVNG